MNSLLDNQKIKKRRHFASPVPAANLSRAESLKDSSFRDSGRKRREKAAFRPVGISSLFERNSGFIEKLNQDVHRHRHINPVPRQKKSEAPVKADSGGKRSSFALPFIPVVSFVLLALGVFFVVQEQGGMSWVDRQVVNFEDGRISQYNLAMYAGVSSAVNQSEDDGDAIPLDLTEAFSWRSYRVRRGDTVSHLAANFSVSMDAIIASNGITNARALREGETLRIPNMDGIPYVVKQGDSLSAISESMGVPLKAILDANDIQSEVIDAGETLFIPGARMNRQELRMVIGDLFINPVRGGRLTSPFGWRNDPISGVRRHHAAVDFAAPLGTPVRAGMEGRISSTGYNPTYGNFIIIAHPGGYQSLYAHLHTISVKTGEQIRQGAQIGTVGNTGYSTGPHLHFAIYRNGIAVNPLAFLNMQN